MTFSEPFSCGEVYSKWVNMSPLNSSHTISEELCMHGNVDMCSTTCTIVYLASGLYSYAGTHIEY